MSLSSSEYAGYDSVGLADLIRSKEVTAMEVAACATDAVRAVNSELNAVVEIYSDCLTANPVIDAPLSGVPTLIKDIGNIEPGRLVEFGSRLGFGNTSSVSTHLFDRIGATGLVPIGRSASSELAIAGVTETAAFGPTRSPWDRDRSAGGSSGGAGAAVGSGMVPIAIGSDGGGSIRIPASCCGVVGLKPTRGRISPAPFGAALAGFATSFVLTRTVRDSALALDLLAGQVAGDPYPITPSGAGYMESLDRSPRGLRIAIGLNSFSSHEVDPEVAGATSAVGELLREMGHQVEADQPAVPWDSFLWAMATMWAADAAHFAGRVSSLTGKPIDDTQLEPQTLTICEEGAKISSQELLSAGDIFNDVNRRLARFFESYDILVTPTLGQLPPEIGRYRPEGTLDSVSFFGSWADVESFLPLFNCGGQPAISLPLAQSSAGLPIGVQLVGGFSDDMSVLQLARALEVALPWAGRIPPIHVSRRS